MRRFGLIALIAASITACNSDSVGPGEDLTLDMAAFGAALTSTGGYEADLYATRVRNALPDSLRLTEEQREQIRALVDAFEVATKSDREAIHAILRRAHDAIRSGKSREEVRAILREGETIRERLAAAHAKLKSDIDAVLTAEQRAWIANHAPRRCNPRNFPPLTEAQKQQIRALERAFATADHEDRAAARRKLLQDILAVLTPAQKASGCLPLG